MAGELYDWDGTVARRFHRDGDRNVVTVTGDAQPLIEDNKKRFNGVEDYRPNMIGKRVASIPVTELSNILGKNGITMHQYMRMAKAEQRAFLAKHIINNCDYRHFRTAPGYF